MKHLCLIPLIAILIACASSPTPSTPTTKIETATAVPTTKIPIPTNTIEPTPIRDPSIPEDYTENASGNYTKIENGFPVIWDTERKAGYSLMFDDFLWDQPPDMEAGTTSDGKKHLTDQLELKVFIDSKIVNWHKLSVTHAENMDPMNTSNWTMLFKSLLLKAMTEKGLLSDPTHFSYDTWFNTSDYTIHYTTKDGNQSLILRDGNVTTVHIRADYEALLTNMNNNNYTLVDGANLGTPNIKYMVKISSDKDGNTFAEIAPSITDALEWSDMRIIEMYLLGITSPLTFVDIPYTPRSSSLGATLAKNHASYPYFIFTRTE